MAVLGGSGASALVYICPAIATGGLSAGAGTPITGTIIGGQAVAPLGPILQCAGGDASSMSASLKAPYVVGGFRSGPVRQLRSTAGLELTVEWLPTTKEASIARSAPVKGFVMVDCATSLTSVGLWTSSVEEVANTSSEDFESMFTTAPSDFSEVGQDDFA